MKIRLPHLLLTLDDDQEMDYDGFNTPLSFLDNYCSLINNQGVMQLCKIT